MKKPAFHIIGALIISLSLISAGAAHVISAEQMLEPFLKASRGLHTVKVDMETTIYDGSSGKTEVGEQLLIRESGPFRSERRFPQGNNILVQDGRRTVTMGVETPHPGARRIDTVFPTIFFQKSVADLLNALNFLGVDTHTVGIDRIERKVVFVVGKGLDQAPGSRLWIEQERRLPLRFVGVGISGGETVVLRAEYKEYRQVDKDVWLPGKIEYYRDDALWIVSILHNISLNEKLAEPLFRISPGGEAGSPVTDFLNIKE
jgi:outer membrane lipoprotein-sorting protein